MFIHSLAPSSLFVSFFVRSWVSAGLPVDTLKLSRAQDYLFSLADRFMSLTVEEGGKINGVMCSIKSSRATRVLTDNFSQSNITTVTCFSLPDQGEATAGTNYDC